MTIDQFIKIHNNTTFVSEPIINQKIIHTSLLGWPS